MKSSNKVVKGFLWRFAERAGAQSVTFIVSLILARMLDPEIYGTLAMVMVVTSILQVFVDSGLGTALVQKKEADDLDFSSVFFFNIFMCLALYVVIFFAAPFLARYYNMADLTPVIRVVGIIVIISGIKNIQQAYVSRNLLFKRFFFATLIGTIGAAIVGISLAWRGFGIWALVAQYLFNALVDTLILWFTVRWRPKALFSWKRLKGLLSFGSKLLGVSLFITTYDNIRALIIGKKYTTSDLAFYNKAQQFPQTLTLNINSSLDSVLLPTMSQKQDNFAEVKSFARKAIGLETYVVMPLMMGMIVCADKLIEVLLKEKWLPCVPFLRLFCLACAFLPVITTDYNVFKAVGRSDVYLKATIVNKILDLLILLITMWHGVIWIASGVLFSSVVCQIVCSVPLKRLVNYSYREQLKDIAGNLLITVLMGGVVFAISGIECSKYLMLAMQILTGILSYVLLSKVMKNKNYEYLEALLRGFFMKADGEKK